MERKWASVLVLLVFYQKMTSGDQQQLGPKKEGVPVEISCQPSQPGSMIVWFRVLEGAGMEFIASFSNNMKKETDSKPSSEFSYGRIGKHILTLKSFSRERDSGLYSCASLFQGKELRFGPMTRLFGERVQPKPTVALTTPRPAPGPATSTAACLCSGQGKRGSGPSLFCAPLILGPLAGGCGLLLLLLIVTILYCNRIRTRRCPHHHKRKPRAKPAGNK